LKRYISILYCVIKFAAYAGVGEIVDSDSKRKLAIIITINVPSNRR
jgi:hypothetical protein